jgi:hypothetical protein
MLHWEIDLNHFRATVTQNGVTETYTVTEVSIARPRDQLTRIIVHLVLAVDRPIVEFHITLPLNLSANGGVISFDSRETPPPKPRPLNHAPENCLTCQNYHGGVYGGNRLVCGFHPYGKDECEDWEDRMEESPKPAQSFENHFVIEMPPLTEEQIQRIRDSIHFRRREASLSFNARLSGYPQQINALSAQRDRQSPALTEDQIEQQEEILERLRDFLSSTHP